MIDVNSLSEMEVWCRNIGCHTCLMMVFQIFRATDEHLGQRVHQSCGTRMMVIENGGGMPQMNRYPSEHYGSMYQNRKKVQKEWYRPTPNPER